MRSHPLESIWEIPESEDEGSPPPEPQKQPIVTSVEDDGEPNIKINISRFFPKGRGLFKKPETQKHPPDQPTISEEPCKKLKLEQHGTGNQSPSIPTNKGSKRGNADPAPPSRPTTRRRSNRQSAKPAKVAPIEKRTTRKKPKRPDAADTKPPPPIQTTSILTTKRSSSPSIKTHRLGHEIQPWTVTDLDPSLLHSYKRTLAGIEAILTQYSLRGELLSHIPALQWPISRNPNRQAVLRYCLCGSDKIARRASASTQRCHDPACAVPGGWYHRACVSEEERRDGATVLRGKWICRACVGRREREGFPEMHTESLQRDRYALVRRRVLAWKERVDEGKCREEVVGGMTQSERGKAEAIDERLWVCGKWPRPGDWALEMYSRWTAFA